MKPKPLNRFSSIPKRNFKNAVIRLLEDEYKLVGSHKVISMIADDIEGLHREFYPDADANSIGTINWRTTKAGCGKPSYGTKAEDYEVVTVKLPLIRDEDVENRIQEFHCGYGRSEKNVNYKKAASRDVETLARLVKSAYAQGGLLTGAELAVLLNRSLGRIGVYLKMYHETHKDILPTKGMVLDMGSRPSHKGAIISLYEQGYPEPDIARQTNHTIEATSRYLKNYKRVKILIEKSFNLMEMVRITGMGRSTIIQYRELVYYYHPDLKKPDEKGEIKEEQEVGMVAQTG